MFNCERCGSNTRAMGMMQVSVPSEFMYNFSKRNMMSKDFRVFSVSWETFDHICTNPSCGFVTNGYGNYVSRLKKENERLIKELERLKEEIDNDRS